MTDARTTRDYELGFSAALAGKPLVHDIEASYSGDFITVWLDGRESSGKKPLRNEYTVSLTATFPFATMPIGASFVVLGAIAVNARGAATLYKRQHPGWDYATLTCADGLVIERVA